MGFCKETGSPASNGKVDTLYINDASTRILKQYKIYYIEYKNQIFPNNSHIDLRAYDTASSYHCPYQISRPKTTKWDCILNCFADCLGMNAP